jgi:RNA polymerase sporulation-specific sigma factor
VSEPIHKIYKTPADFRRAIEDLTDVDWARLRKIARSQSIGMEFEDLLQEAIERGIKGTRSWPEDVDIFRFVGETMRSVDQSARAKAKRRSNLSVVPRHGEQIDLEDIAESTPTPEDLVSLQAEYEISCSLFENDAQGLEFMQARVAGFEKNDIMTLLGVDGAAYDTISRRVRRTVERRSRKEMTNG